MRSKSTKCIYCGRFFNPTKRQGDHALTLRVFGEFEGDSRFRGACPQCNNSFGRNEQQLSQSGPLGFYRSIVKPNLGTRNHRGSYRQQGALGAPPPKFTIRTDERTLIVKPSPQDPRDAEAFDQLVILYEGGREHHIRLFRGMTVESLRAKIDESDASGMKEAYLQCDESDWEHFKSLLAELYPSAKIAEDETIEPGSQRLPGRVRFQFGIEYFQALAKIAFHYYLVRSRRGYRGDEEALAPLRKFIKHGGDKEEFFHNSGRRFAVPFGQKVAGCTISPPNWCHVFAVDETKEAVVVYMQLYVGPGSIRPPDYVTLGKIDSQIMLPNGVWANILRYQPGRTGRYTGIVEDITPSPLDSRTA